jgi:hypothetical protein
VARRRAHAGCDLKYKGMSEMPIKLPDWWIASEIPFIESDWRNIQLYCNEPETPWKWKNAIYLIRLSPPFAIRYSNEISSPLIYIGSGDVEQRWSYHRWWLQRLSYYLPGARYEVWISHHLEFKRVEADALFIFQDKTKRLPLMNRRSEAGNRGDEHGYDKDYYSTFIKADRRYFWSIEPFQKDVREYFDKGKLEEPLPGLKDST